MVAALGWEVSQVQEHLNSLVLPVFNIYIYTIYFILVYAGARIRGTGENVYF